MATREQVRELVERGVDYSEIGRSLGVTPGQAYLIGTGMPVDGSDSYTSAQRHRLGALPSAQHLIGPGTESPTSGGTVREWISARVRADEPMRRAAHRDEAPAAGAKNTKNTKGAKNTGKKRAGTAAVRSGRGRRTSEKER